MMKGRKCEDVSISMYRKLNCVMVSGSQHCIFKIHDVMKNVNRKAYEPEMVAIGPYHRGMPHLEMMENHKIRFLKLLLQRKNEDVSTYVAAMRLLEEQARLCYAESVEHISSDEFIEMMVLDGCFVIELMRMFQMLKCSLGNDSLEKIKNDPLFRMEWTLNFLQRDLMLFENQLPYFVLIKLYEMIEFPSQPDEFNYLAVEFFNNLFPGHGRNRDIDLGPQDNIKHLLDLIHRNWSSLNLKPNTGKTYTMENIELIRSSTELAEAGINFQNVEDEVSFDIVFKRGTLKIPVLTIEGRTESFLRNLIAFEQHCGDAHFNIVTDYMTFFACLIKSVEDVTKLSRHGIIRSFVGDDIAVCRMFSTMNDYITGPSRNFHYAEVFRKVNRHCHKPMNNYMASLRRKYMHSPWGIISILAASTLLLVTLLQVIFQILSWKRGLN